MSCDEIRELLPDFLAGTLPPDANRALGEHLANCSACALEVATLEQTWNDMALVADEVPSDALRAGFYARLHALERRTADSLWRALAAGLERGLAALWPRRPLAQLAAMAALLALGIGLGFAARGAFAPAPVSLLAEGAPAAPRPAAPPRARAAPRAPAGPALAAATHEPQLVGAPVPPIPAADSGEEMRALREEVRSLSHLVALSLLRNDSAADRLQGVSFGRQASATDPRILEALLEAANRDPNDNVRLAAIDALRPLVARQEIRTRLLDGFDEQRSPLVQIAVVDAVAAAGRQGTTDLRSLLARPRLDPAVRQRVETKLAARS